MPTSQKSPLGWSTCPLKKRLIPCLFLKNGFLVRSEQFQRHQLLGNAIHQVERFNAWDVDELIYTDISPEASYDIRRDDTKVKNEDNILDILVAVSKTCFMPLTFGGKIRTLNDVKRRISLGADKVSINSAAHYTPNLIQQSANMFGSQAVVAAMDVYQHDNGTYEVYVDSGQTPTGQQPQLWGRYLETLGAGEIFLNSINKDGMANGYDLTLVQLVTQSVRIPVIACGGVGQFSHLVDGITVGRADAVAAGNIFHFTELSALQARKTLRDSGIAVRSL
ncbi:MAG: imidazole glycerol phosphate synthase cyclase subunit [Cyanobacteria bacterium P01_H01_bin.74]